jgi:hypothetical protein
MACTLVVDELRLIIYHPHQPLVLGSQSLVRLIWDSSRLLQVIVIS